MCNNLDIRYRLKKDLSAAMQPLLQKLIIEQKEQTIAIQKASLQKRTAKSTDESIITITE